MSEDHELLRSYAANRSESAFARLVSRHADFVYATALRMVGGDSHLAHDVAQTVFIDLNRKAGSLVHLRSLEAWLYQATRYASAKAVRTEQRRWMRERAANEMRVEAIRSPGDSPDDWERIAPVLDEAMEQLPTDDREAILHRFFARKSFRAVAESVGSTEEAARKRVSRALEKLRDYLLRSGVRISETSLIAALAAGAAQGAPPAFAATVVSAALAAPSSVSGAATVLQFMATKKIAIASLGLLAIPLVMQHQTAGKLKEENRSLTEQLQSARAALESEKARTNAPRLVPTEHLELMRLRAEVTALRQERQQAAQAPAPAAPEESSKDSMPEFLKWAEGILNGPSEVQGIEGGNIRRKSLNREALSEAEQTLLMNLVRRAGEIEKSPESFSEFQSSFVASLLNWNGDPRISRVKEIIHAAAVTANEQQMNFNAPTLNADSWPLEQKQLNRSATAEIQGLLTQEERATFDRAFLGIMGIDFGVSFGGPHD